MLAPSIKTVVYHFNKYHPETSNLCFSDRVHSIRMAFIIELDNEDSDFASPDLMNQIERAAEDLLNSIKRNKLSSLCNKAPKNFSQKNYNSKIF